MPLDLVQSPSDSEALLGSAMVLRDEFEMRRQVQAARMMVQDAWLLLYLLVDQGQDGQPQNRGKHYTATISNIVDTARRVLTRNPVKYHIAAQQSQSQSRLEREPFRRLENVLHGLLYDIDKQLISRGEMRGRSQVGFHVLVRGAWAYKLHLSKEADTSTGSPIFYQQLDPTMVLPTFDSAGQESAIASEAKSISQLMYEYDELAPMIDKVRQAVAARRGSNGSGRSNALDWLHAPVNIIEYSSREEHGVLADFTTLPSEISDAVKLALGEEKQFIWLQQPYKHGFGRPMIRYGNVNGVPVKLQQGLASQMGTNAFPQARTPLYTGGSQTSGYVDSTGLWTPSSYHRPEVMAQSIDPMGMFAGRSIFATVAHLVPELNRAIALLKDAVEKEVRGTWTFKSRDGSMVGLNVGNGQINALGLQESLERIPMNIMAPDLMGTIQMIKQEISDGTLDLKFVLASEQDSSGYLRARQEQGALISVEDYKDGVQNWATDVGTSFITQFRKSRKGMFKNWSITGRDPGQMTKYFVVDIEGTVEEMLRAGKEPPIIEAVVKPSMPIDMMAKINMAKSAIDPNNPIMGLAMALDIIMELDDADAAYDMIMEDIANRNPTIQLINIANAMAQNGAPEVAQMILSDTFKAAFHQSVMANSGAGGTPPATGTPNGAPKGTPPQVQPPEASSGGATEVQRAPQGG